MTVTDGLDRSSQQQIRILLRMMKNLSGKMRVGWLNLQNAFWQNDCLFWFALRYIKVYDYEYIHSTDTRIINENSVDECKSYDTSVRPAVSVSLLVFPFAARPKTMQTCSENKNMNNWLVQLFEVVSYWWRTKSNLNLVVLWSILVFAKLSATEWFCKDTFLFLSHSVFWFEYGLKYRSESELGTEFWSCKDTLLVAYFVRVN